MLRIKKILISILVVLMIASCATSNINTYPYSKEDGPKWMNSSIIGSVTKDTPTNPKDDFFLYSNKDWILNAKIPEGEFISHRFNEGDDTKTQNTISLLAGKEANFHEGRLAQQFYKSLVDMETRNKLGIKPLLPYIEAIKKIKTLDELTAYQMRNDQPCNNFLKINIATSLSNNSKHIVNIQPVELSLGSSDEYAETTDYGKRLKDALSFEKLALLQYAGFSKEESQKIIDNMFEFEEKIAPAIFSIKEQYNPGYYDTITNPISVEELKEKPTNFPLLAILEPYTKAGITEFNLSEPACLEKLNELYIEKNLELFKSKLICDTLNFSIYLDKECIDISDKKNSLITGMEYHSNLEKKAVSITETYLTMGVSRMYVEKFISPELKERIAKLCNQIVDVYQVRLKNKDWLSEETRKQAIEKLEATHVNSVYPDSWEPFQMDGLSLNPTSNIVENIIAIEHYSQQKSIAEYSEPADRKTWLLEINPLIANAFNCFEQNSIYILAGILKGAIYQPDFTDEQLLGTIGMIIGHEISHSFDSVGASFDKKGNLNNWWTENDKKSFEKKTKQLANYYSTIEGLDGEYIDGNFTLPENVADLGGFACMLEIAKQYDNFNYDLFFRSYAQIWGHIQTREHAEILLTTDGHSPGQIRVNAIIQQFPEFYETYDVKEGDGMYLAPEKRIIVW